MRHVVLGAGGIGGLLASLLSRAGEDVTVVARPARDGVGRSGRFAIRSALFGDFTEQIDVHDTAPPGADIVWVTVKATDLERALERADPELVGGAVVIPLLNGIDHVAVLRQRYRTVCGATIRIESHRLAPGVIEQRSPFANLSIALNAESVLHNPCSDALDTLRTAGFETSTSTDETSLLWDKLAFLAPIALATTAWDRSLGAVRDEPEFRASQQEVVAAARTDGASTTLHAVQSLTDAAPATMRSSMQLDVAAGREPELDAIAGAVLRRTNKRGDGAPATRALARHVGARVTHRASPATPAGTARS